MTPDSNDLSSFSMIELYRLEVETQAAALTAGLLALEGQTPSSGELENLMRAAHSLKGAARMVQVRASVRIAHAMEDCFVAAQKSGRGLTSAQVDLLFRGVDLLTRQSQDEEPDGDGWEHQNAAEIEAFMAEIQDQPSASTQVTQPPNPLLKQDLAQSDGPSGANIHGDAPLVRTEAAGVQDSRATDAARADTAQADTAQADTAQADTDKVDTDKVDTAQHDAASTAQAAASPESAVPQTPVVSGSSFPEQSPSSTGLSSGAAGGGAARGDGSRGEASQTVRVTARHLTQLLALAGESVVASRWVEAFTSELGQLRKQQAILSRSLEDLQELYLVAPAGDQFSERLAATRQRSERCRDTLLERIGELEAFDQRFNLLSQQLYQRTLDSRMRPFSDVTAGYPRMVRDIARNLGKEARLVVEGENTPVDRDVLEQLEAPLNHLLRNAVDHGVETPEERERTGKNRTGVIRLGASHKAGMLQITVADDGHGLETERLRQSVQDKGLAIAEIAKHLSKEELLEFLFLPGFSLKEGVTEISGRGVGLDAVQAMVKAVSGSVTVTTEAGRGMRFVLQLPLTLSVLRTLLVQVAGEPYAFPLSRVEGAIQLRREEVQSIEGRLHFEHDGHHIGLVSAQQVLALGEASTSTEELKVVLIGDRSHCYGIVVDQFLGEQELVVRPLDSRLGKVQDISAAALMPDQRPVLIIDVDDLSRSIENLISGNRLSHIWRSENRGITKRRKRVLVVDDSLTVRELQRKLIDSKGYEVEVAVDGIDGWNAARSGHYDLVVTDVDMPRMDGIELVTQIKKDPHLQSLPVMIVSYKDREEDRRRGLMAGADYYLTKSSFHDSTLLQAIQDLIGEAVE